MAINVVTWVWNHSRSKHGARLVLLAIADYANGEDGDGAWPGIKTLARKANISVTAVHAALKALAELGELEIIPGGGKVTPNGPTNAYRVIMIDYPGEPVTDGDNRTSGTPAESVPRTKSAPVQNQHGSGFGTPADSAPLPIPVDGVPIPVDGVPIPDGGGTDSVPRTVLEPSGEPPLNRPSPAAAAAAGPETAQTLIQEWLDHCDATGQLRPFRPVIGQTASVVGKLLAEGASADEVRRGMQQWHAGGLHPSALPSIVHQVRTGAPGWQAVNGDGGRRGGGRRYVTERPGSAEEALA